MLSEDRDRESSEVVLKLPRDDKESNHQLFQPLVFGLWSIHRMADVVHGFWTPLSSRIRAPLSADSETAK